MCRRRAVVVAPSSLTRTAGLVKGKFSANGEEVAVVNAYDWSQGPHVYDHTPGAVRVLAATQHAERRSNSQPRR